MAEPLSSDNAITALDQLRPEVGKSHRSAMLLDQPRDTETAGAVASAAAHFKQIDLRGDVR